MKLEEFARDSGIGINLGANLCAACCGESVTGVSERGFRKHAGRTVAWQS